jgi:hypothetical protein
MAPVSPVIVGDVEVGSESIQTLIVVPLRCQLTVCVLPAESVWLNVPSVTEALGMVRDGDGWLVRVAGPRGEEQIRARLVIAADGVETMVARWAGLDTRVRARDMESCAQYVVSNIDFDPVNPAFPSTSFHGEETFNDFMIGARYTWELGEKWNLTLRGDGSFGDTDGTWNGSALFSRETGNGAWLFGYRAMQADFEIGDTDVQVTLAGPEIGYAFVW